MNNYSKQREVILDILKNNNTHPTALELYEIVHLKYPKISKSTLYRNLNILVNQGLVKRIKVLHGADRFDYVNSEHSHAVCEVCGRVFDLDTSFFQDNFQQVCENKVVVMKKMNSITIYGICNECGIIEGEEDYGIKRK